jgi:hypothetical protein
MQASEESDYTDEIDERAYTFFQELFSRSSIPIREWMDWEDGEKFRFRNVLRFNEFVGWLYPRSGESEEEGGKGEWENRRLKIRDSLRSLALVYTQDKEAFEAFRRGDLSVDAAYVRVVARQYEQQVDRAQEVYNDIDSCTVALENLPFKMLRDQEQRSKLNEKLEALKAAIAAIDES